MIASVVIIVLSAMVGSWNLYASEDELQTTKVRNRRRVFATVLLTTAMMGALQLAISGS
jgi:heme A synthase